jgi:hypothetical protein
MASSSVQTFSRLSMFDDADLGTIVAFVKVPYKIDGEGNVTGFSVAKAEGDPFEGAIVVDPAVENEFEGHRIAERQYVIEDIIPDYSLSMGTIEGDEIDPATGRPVRIKARRRRLSSAVKKAQAAIEEGKEPGAYEAKIRSKVRGQASDSVFKGVVNIDYGNAEADANDIYMTSRGPVSKPLLGVRAAEQQQLESRTGSVFESRQADEAPLTRPEGQFEVREKTAFQKFKNLAIKRLQDKYVDILSIQEDVEAFLGRPVEESKDFRMKEELMYGKAANDLAKLNEKVDNLTATMNRLGVSTGDLTDYMYALHAPERNAVILERDAKIIAFEMPEAGGFAVVDREELAFFCEKHVRRVAAQSKDDSYLKLYTRRDRKDVITKLYLSDIQSLRSYRVWKYFNDYR